MKYILLGLAAIILGALLSLGYVHPREVWEGHVSVADTLSVPVPVLMAVGASLLLRRVRVLLYWLIALVGFSTGMAWLLQPSSDWGARIVGRGVAQVGGSDFVTLAVDLALAGFLVILLGLLAWAWFRLAILGWARNRLLGA